MRKALVGLLIGLVGALLVLATDPFFSLFSSGQGPLQAIELKTYDWRLINTARPSTARSDIALVEIDEYSLNNLEAEAGRWPWPRLLHAKLLNFIARAPARVVVYDIDFAEPDSREEFDYGHSTWRGRKSDDELLDAVERSGNVILLAEAASENAAADGTTRSLPESPLELDTPGAFERPLIRGPFLGLDRRARMLGHSLFVLDDDGVIRHTIPLVRSHDAVVPSVGLAAAMLARGFDWSTLRPEGAGLRIGNDLLPLTWRHIRDAAGESRYQWALIHYKGGTLGADMSTRTYTRYHASDVLEAENQLLREQRPELDPAVFKDKIVFVGATAEGLSDVFQTPFGRERMAGIQVHAAVTDDVLSSRFLKETSTPVRVATALVMALAAGVLAVTIPAWWATLAVLVTIAAYGTATTFALAAGHVLALFQPALASALALFGGVGYQYFVEGRERRKMRRLFGQYVSKDVCAQLVANPELARLGGQRREMTVLFSDIRGFTTVTERGQPEEIVGMLNEYFTRMVDIVFKNNGTVDKFVGDMVMALFGAPLDDSAHPDHAVEAAIQMIEALGQLNRNWGAQGRFAHLDIGIGINTGPMIAGNIGSDQIMSYTVIGDAVNLGSRLESLNKQYGTRIIISEATRERLKSPYHVRPLGDVVVKGKTKPVAIFEILGRGDGTMPSPTAMPTDTEASSEAHS